MLELSASLINQPILSLRTGAQVATTVAPVINPANLKIEGFYCEDVFDSKQLILLTQDIRERVSASFVVDDYEVLVEPEDLIRLEKLIALQFTLTDKAVYTDKKHRLGKVVDYAVEKNSLFVQKLYVGQNILKNINNNQLTVDRNQIVEITDKRIIIKDPLQGVKEASPATALA